LLAACAIALTAAAWRADVRPAGHAPDLVVRQVSKAGLSGDWQRLHVTGRLRVTVANVGDMDASESALAVYDADRTLATEFVDALRSQEEAVVDVPISTTVTFRDAPLWVAADPFNAVAEFDELDNVRRTGEDCTVFARGRHLPAADLTASYLRFYLTASPGEVRAVARVGNGGAATAPAGVDVVFASGGRTKSAATLHRLAPGDYEDVGVVWVDEDLAELVTARVDADLSGVGDCDRANDEIAAVPTGGLAPEALPAYLPRLSGGAGAACCSLRTRQTGRFVDQLRRR
jgi:hypothetical protein